MVRETIYHLDAADSGPVFRPYAIQAPRAKDPTEGEGNDVNIRQRGRHARGRELTGKVGKSRAHATGSDQEFEEEPSDEESAPRPFESYLLPAFNTRGLKTKRSAESDDDEFEPPKKRKKRASEDKVSNLSTLLEDSEHPAKPKQGRPKKEKSADLVELQGEKPKRKRGRPRKTVVVLEGESGEEGE